MTQQFKQGDAVEWNSGRGKATGEIVKRITEPTEVDGNKVKATKDDPRYLVENDNTESVTGHKVDALSALEDDGKDQNDLSQEQQETIEEFQKVVNMTIKELKDWLPTEESKSVGQKDDGGEAIGHKSGKKIIKLLDANGDDYTEDDLSHMKKVIGYVHRHIAQKPSGDVEDSRWRYSLMNWGHDPLKS